MIKEALIFGDNGYIFGKNARDFERLNIACPTDELKKALNRLKNAMKKRGFI